MSRDTRDSVRDVLSSIDADLMAVWLELGSISDESYLQDILTEVIILQQQSEKLLDYVSAAVA